MPDNNKSNHEKQFDQMTRDYLKKYPKWSDERNKYVGVKNTPSVFRKKAVISSQYVIQYATFIVSKIEEDYDLSDEERLKAIAYLSFIFLGLIRNVPGKSYPAPFIGSLLDPVLDRYQFVTLINKNSDIYRLFIEGANQYLGDEATPGEVLSAGIIAISLIFFNEVDDEFMKELSKITGAYGSLLLYTVDDIIHVTDETFSILESAADRLFED